MRLANFLLPLLPLAPCGSASSQLRGLHNENCDSSGRIAPTDLKTILSDLAVRVVGTALMTMNVEEQTVTETLNAISEDIYIESYTLKTLIPHLDDTAPLRLRDSHDLATAFVNWKDSTNIFLGEVLDASETFRLADPHLASSLASDLATFKSITNKFCDKFQAIVPLHSLAITNHAADLAEIFELAVHELKYEEPFGGFDDNAMILLNAAQLL